MRKKARLRRAKARQTFRSKRPRFAIGEREVMIAVVAGPQTRVMKAIYNRSTGAALLIDKPPTYVSETSYGTREFLASREHVLFAEHEGIRWVRGWDTAAARALEVAIALRGSK